MEATSNLHPNSDLYWHLSPNETLNRLQTTAAGLTPSEAKQRKHRYGSNIIRKRQINGLIILVRQFTSNPLIIILAVATLISYFLGQHISSYYIFGIMAVSILLGFWNEYTAERTVDNLLKKISPTALVVRNQEKMEIPVSELTVGDIVLLSQGAIIPADLRLIEVHNLETNESILTGESSTVFKTATALKSPPSNLQDYTNIAFMGSLVESGWGIGVVTRVGKNTEFGKIAKAAAFVKPATDFQKGLASFGNLIMKVVIIMTAAIFTVNALLGHQLVNSLLFSLAIAIGLTPELLPVIVTICLSHGAGKLAKKHIVAKQLIAIENLGNMDILCTDKTGTLTEGEIALTNYYDIHSRQNPQILNLALLCNNAVARHQVKGNAIDTAIWNYAQKHHFPFPNAEKIAEEPFDFNRKAMYTVIKQDRQYQLIAKGAPEDILTFCHPQTNQQFWRETFANLNNQGLRVVALAYKKINRQNSYSWQDVQNLILAGYLTFLDIPKKGVKGALARLRSLNVATKIITGDNEIITKHICQEIGISSDNIMLGSDLARLSDHQLREQILCTDIFCRVTPEQKLTLIQTLQQMGHTVGYLGDGINDIPSLRGADVGISVNSAVDVAKDAAAVVLLKKGLDVIADGIIEGRKTFNNTIKYILLATSSNFGNMFSAAGASFFLSFLPMTPVQILLTNGLYDFSQMAIPSDNVDPESLLKPRHWNIEFIKNYMLFFGPLSSIFDYATFGVMLWIFQARDALFQTGWFIESLATEILVVFVIRTAKTPFFSSKPSKWLLLTCLSLVAIGIALPFSPLAPTLGFTPPPPLYFLIIIVMIAAYLALIEIVKKIFLSKFSL